MKKIYLYIAMLLLANSICTEKLIAFDGTYYHSKPFWCSISGVGNGEGTSAAANSCDSLPKGMPPFPEVQRNASFEGGPQAWSLFLQKNVRSSVAVQNNAPPGTYKVLARFIIDTTGNIDTVRVLQNPGYGMGEELARVIKLSSSKWHPTLLKNGGKIKAMIQQPFTYEITKEVNAPNMPMRKPAN